MQQTLNKIINRDLIKIIHKYIDLEFLEYKDSNLETIIYYNNNIFRFDPNMVDKKLLLEKIVKNGELYTAKWFIQHFQPIEMSIEYIVSVLFYLSCRNGHLKMAKWLYKHFKLTEENIQRDNHHRAFRETCTNGHLKVIQWLDKEFKSIEGELSISTSHYSNYASETFANSSSRGHIKICKWLISKFDHPIRNMYRHKLLDLSELESICGRGYLEMYKWLNTEFKLTFDDGYKSKLFKRACANNKVGMAKWLARQFDIENILHMNKIFENVCCGIVPSLETIKWLFTDFNIKAEYLDLEACFNGAFFWGHFRVLKWLYKIFKPSFGSVFLLYALEYSYEEKRINICQWILEKFHLNEILSKEEDTEEQYEHRFLIAQKCGFSTIEEMIADIISRA